MQLQVGSSLDSTPIGSKIVFGVCACCYVLYLVDHHAFIGLDLVCRPVDVVYGLQLQRLLLASVVHTSLLGLSLALLVCWRRFAWIEHRTGTLGFLVWFAWSSVLVHGAYCMAAVCLAPFLGSWLVNGEVHGLLPLLTANLVASIKESDSGTVWLWPLPFHVSVRSFPAVIVGLSWLMHWEAHLDVLVAYALASAVPRWLEEPVPLLLDRTERTAAGQWMLAKLQASDGFVCRPPGYGSGPGLPAPATAPVPAATAAAASGPALPASGPSCIGSKQFPAGAPATSASLASTSAGSCDGAGSPSHHMIHDDDEEMPAPQLLTDEHDLTDQYNHPWH